MRRACTACGRVVAEAAYCPFCLQPTIEYVPRRNEGVNNLPKKEQSESTDHFQLFGEFVLGFLQLFFGG